MLTTERRTLPSEARTFGFLANMLRFLRSTLRFSASMLRLEAFALRLQERSDQTPGGYLLFCLDVREKPLRIRPAGLCREHHKLRNFIRMRGEKGLAQGIDSLLRRLDDEELLAVVLDGFLPPVKGADLGENVDAGGDALLDERLGQRGGVEAGADGGQDDDGLHGAAVRAMASAAWCATSRAALRYCP